LESFGGFVVSKAFEVTEDHRSTQRLRESCQLLVDDASRLSGFLLTMGCGDGPLSAISPRLFVQVASGGMGSSANGDSVGDSVEPVAYEVAVPDPVRAANQNEESRLEGVFHVLIVPQNTTAYAKNHRAMPGDECGESRLISPFDESFQQLGFAQAGDRASLEQQIQLIRPDPGKSARHAATPPDVFSARSPLYLRGPLFPISLSWKFLRKNVP